MIRTRTMFLVLAMSLGFAITAAAQSQVKISNTAGEKRKICVYNDDDRAGIVPKRCFTLNANEVTYWYREGDTSKFMVKIFVPGVLDNYLYTRHLPGDTQRIIMGEGGRFGFSREPERKVTKYILKVCNRQYNEKVYFTLGFETNKTFFTEGWWNVDKGQCLDFPISEKLKNDFNVEFGTVPRTYYFARTYGSTPLFWRGGDNDYNLCINNSNAFRKTQFNRDGSGNYVALPCTAAGDALVRFRRLEDPKTDQQYYYLTF